VLAVADGVDFVDVVAHGLCPLARAALTRR
jgi:hypothetical protein